MVTFGQRIRFQAKCWRQMNFHTNWKLWGRVGAVRSSHIFHEVKYLLYDSGQNSEQCWSPMPIILSHFKWTVALRSGRNFHSFPFRPSPAVSVVVLVVGWVMIVRWPLVSTLLFISPILTKLCCAWLCSCSTRLDSPLSPPSLPPLSFVLSHQLTPLPTSLIMSSVFRKLRKILFSQPDLSWQKQ